MTISIMDASTAIGNPKVTLSAFKRGFAAGLPFILSNGLAGVVMGVAYKGLGLSLAAAAVSSAVIYSATAQAVTLGMWSASPPVAAMVVACLATNARYLVMGAQLHQLFGRLRRRVMLPILFLLADASWLMTIADADRNGPDAGYLFGASVPMAIGWIAGTSLGYILPLRQGGPLTVAAALLPAMFVVTLLPTQWRGRITIWPWALSAVTALLTSRLLEPNWAMLIGGGVGTTFSMIRGDRA